jgi:hypothetical protein
MHRTLLRAVLLSLLLGGVVLGCHKPMVQQKVPPDPLLISKKPIEGRSQLGEPVLSTRIDPQPPPVPRRETQPIDPTRTVSNDKIPIPNDQ